VEVLEILKLFYDDDLLKGFKSGFFDETGKKFFGYTMHSSNMAEFENFYHFYVTGKSYSSYRSGDANEMDYLIDNGDGTYRSKELKQLIEEKIINYLSFTFLGVFHDNNWNIQDSLVCHEEGDEREAMSKIENIYSRKKFFTDNSIFHPVPSAASEIDFEKVQEMIFEETGEKVNRYDIHGNGLRKITSFIKSLSKEKMPYKQTLQNVHYREFVGQPWLVAYKKQEIKSSINKAYENYISQSVFIPLVQFLKVKYSQEFTKTYTLNHPENYPLIYPHSKKYVISAVKVVNKNRERRLYYFLYLPNGLKIYQWTYPKHHGDSSYYFHVEEMQEDFKNLSSWGEDFDFLEPSVTMDDEKFWSEYVFKKQDDEYLFLKPIDYDNFQKDIYPQF